jgi:hypothetical protein
VISIAVLAFPPFSSAIFIEFFGIVILRRGPAFRANLRVIASNAAPGCAELREIAPNRPKSKICNFQPRKPAVRTNSCNFLRSRRAIFDSTFG